ncbi:reverse transcriptase domain-containing protein [Tanacetum coccineum]
MHTRASNSELVELLPEPERTLNRRLRRRNRRVPFEQRNNPPQKPRVVYAPILDINYFCHFLVTLQNLNPMDDEPMWAADRVVAPTPGSAITIPETANEFAIKDSSGKTSTVEKPSSSGNISSGKLSLTVEYTSLAVGKYSSTKNMLVEVGKFTFLADLVILEMEEDSKVPLILGRAFLYTVDEVVKSSIPSKESSSKKNSLLNSMNSWANDCKIETEEISDRYVAPCFVNGLEAYDSEINLGKEENMISNEFAMKLCLDYEVKCGYKVVKKELIVALRGEIYFVKFLINPEEDDVKPGVVLGRRFARLEEERPVIETMAYSDKYKKLLDEICIDKMKLDGEMTKKEEEAIIKVKGEALIKKEDPRAFVILIRLEANINLNALADTDDVKPDPHESNAPDIRDGGWKQVPRLVPTPITRIFFKARTIEKTCFEGITKNDHLWLVSEETGVANSNKHKIEQILAAFLSDESSAIHQKKVSPKLGDPGSFLITCNFNEAFSCNGLADLGTNINLMSYSLYAKLSLENLKPTKMSIRLADRSFQYPVGIAENIIDVIDEILEEDFDALLDEGSKILYSIDGTILEETLFAEFDEFTAMTTD